MNDFLKSWMSERDRIIVFAGVFDPVHKGHISAAKQAASWHGRTVVFLPERVPQHKHSATTYEHRLKMLKIATAKESNFQVMDYPKDNQWVEETFTWLKNQFPNKKFAWLVGEDAAQQMSEWKGIDKLAEFGVERIIIASRKYSLIEKLPKIEGVRIVQLKTRHHHMSSTFIREDLKHRHTSLPDGVYDYIKTNDLYR